MRFMEGDLCPYVMTTHIMSCHDIHACALHKHVHTGWQLQAELSYKEQELASVRAAHRACQSRLAAIEAQDAKDPSCLSTVDAVLLRQENAAHVEELIETIEELNVSKRALEVSNAACSRLEAEMQSFVDQRNLLYRNYAQEVTSMRREAARTKQDRVELEERAQHFEAAAKEHSDMLSSLHACDDLKQLATEKVMLKLRLDQVWSTLYCP